MTDPRPPRFPPPQFPPPPQFSPPQFPPHRPRLFARTPPAVFPVILGLIGLGLALRRAAAVAGFGAGLAEMVLGLVSGLWVLAVVAIKAKVWRRLPVLVEDLRPLPGRAGLAASTMSGMAMGAVVAPFSPGLALVLLLGSLLAHLGLGVLVLRVMIAQGRDGWVPNPAWHLALTGGIVAAAPLAGLGWTGLASVLAFAGLATALLIWGLSVSQVLREVPPAALRPMLAIHLAPAALLSLSFGALGWPGLQLVFAALALLIALALLAAARWLLAGGVSALWGALTFPLAALAQALLAVWPAAGLVVTAAALGVIPWIGWLVLKRWPGGKLAAQTNAAEA